MLLHIIIEVKTLNYYTHFPKGSTGKQHFKNHPLTSLAPTIIASTIRITTDTLQSPQLFL